MSNKLQGWLAPNILTADSNNSTNTCAKKTPCNINCIVYVGVIKYRKLTNSQLNKTIRS